VEAEGGDPHVTRSSGAGARRAVSAVRLRKASMGAPPSESFRRNIHPVGKGCRARGLERSGRASARRGKRCEKRSAINLHLAATESPVGAQKEVVAKNLMFKIIQRAAADQAKISDIVFVLPNPGQSAVFSRTKRERHLAHIFFFGGAIPEACVAGAKDCAQYAVAGTGLASPARAQSISMAMRAGSFRECEGH